MRNEELHKPLLGRRNFLKFGAIIGISMFQLMNSERSKSERRIYQPGDVLGKTDSSQPFLQMTFDDFTDPFIPTDECLMRILDLGRRYGAHFTFFPTGHALFKIPDLWRRALQEGHGIENHTFDHVSLSELSEEEIREQIKKAQQAAKQVFGKMYRKQRFLRPPFGDGFLKKLEAQSKIQKVAKEFGLIVAIWSADTLGWMENRYGRIDEETIQSMVKSASVMPGDIILQHAIGNELIAAERILQVAASQNLHSRTLSEAVDNIEPFKSANTKFNK